MNALVEAGKRVVLVYPIPEAGYHIPNTLAQLVLNGENPTSFVRPWAYYQKRHKFIFELFGQVQDRRAIVHVFPHKKLCDEERCIVYGEWADHFILMIIT